MAVGGFSSENMKFIANGISYTNPISPDIADAAGKAFELYVAKHILYNLKDGDNPDSYCPKHFSHESGDSPSISIDKQKEKLGKELYTQINFDAKMTAEYIIQHINTHSKDLLTKEYDVYWTSKPKDLIRLTGDSEVRNSSDLVIQKDNIYHGISLKYLSTNKKTFLRSPGIRDLTEELKADSVLIDNILDQHTKAIDEHVGHFIGNGTKKDKHDRFKEISNIGNEKHAIENAKEASRNTHKQLAYHFSYSFSRLDHTDKIKIIRKMTQAEEQTKIKPYIAFFNRSKREVMIEDPIKSFNEINDKTSSYDSRYIGASFSIYANHDDGTYTKVISIGIKNKESTPYSSITGRVEGRFRK